MKCPNCNKEIKLEGSSFCNNCGFSLYGPRNVNLTDIYKDQNKQEKIEKITGFKLDNLSNYDEDVPLIESESILNSNYNNPSEKKKFLKKEGFYSNIKKEKNKIIIIFLAILATLFFLLWIISAVTKAKVTKCPKCEKEVPVTEKTNFYYGNNFISVFVPAGYKGVTLNQNIILNNEDLTVTIMPPVEGSLELTSIYRVEKTYFDAGFPEAKREAFEADKRKAFGIKYSKDNIFYEDIYYQFDENTILYIELSSPTVEKVVVDANIKKILSLAKINPKEEIKSSLSSFDKNLVLAEFK